MVRFLEIIVKTFAAVLALAICWPFIFLGLFADTIGRYSEASIIVSKIPFYLGEYIRLYYYKCTLEGVGREVVFKYGSFCQYRKANIGNRVLIGYYSVLGEITTGDDILVGGFVNFLSGTKQHSFSYPNIPINRQNALGRQRIYIGSNLWIGSNSVIAADIGDHCIIGTGSVLLKPAESNAIYSGNPAQKIKYLDKADTSGC
jgi:acetyltransferase-like isoleucine patch superfamily enzyme